MLIFVLHFCIIAIAMLLVANFMKGFHVKGFGPAFVAALVLGLVNTFLRPILMFVFGPINWLTLGLFGLVINGLLLKLVAAFVDGFDIDDWITAIIGSVLISIVSEVMHRILL